MTIGNKLLVFYYCSTSSSSRCHHFKLQILAHIGPYPLEMNKCRPRRRQVRGFNTFSMSIIGCPVSSVTRIHSIDTVVFIIRIKDIFDVLDIKLPVSLYSSNFKPKPDTIVPVTRQGPELKSIPPRRAPPVVEIVFSSQLHRATNQLL